MKLHHIEKQMLDYLENYFLSMMDYELNGDPDDDVWEQDNEFVEHVEFMLHDVSGFKFGHLNKDKHQDRWKSLVELYREQMIEDMRFLSSK